MRAMNTESHRAQPATRASGKAAGLKCDAGWWSRHIADEHRVVYKVADDGVPAPAAPRPGRLTHNFWERVTAEVQAWSGACGGSAASVRRSWHRHASGAAARPQRRDRPMLARCAL